MYGRLGKYSEFEPGSSYVVRASGSRNVRGVLPPNSVNESYLELCMRHD